MSSTKDFHASVGLSRKWDAREAGREVAEDTLRKLNGKKPNFFLLFSTIHYEKYGGFQEFLDGVWEILPEGTPLIGGTVAGFIIPQGCFTRGATALAVSYPNMDVAVGVGHNTKRNPKKAGRECAEMIKKGLKDSKYKNKFLFEIVSGPTMPKLSFFNKKFIKSKILEYLISSSLFSISERILQKGVGREEELLDELAHNLPDYTLIGGSTYDDNKMIKNYQFFNEDVFTNSVVLLGISSEFDLSISTAYGLIDTNKQLSVTKIGGEDRIIHEINNKPATDEFLDKLGWPHEFLDNRIYLKTYFTPLGFKKGEILFPEIIGYFIGDSIICGYKIKDKTLRLLSASGKSLMNAVDLSLDNFRNKENLMAFGISCAITLQTLGANVYCIRKKLINFFKEIPFLLLYGAGIDVKSEKREPYHINMAFNIGVIQKQHESIYN